MDPSKFDSLSRALASAKSRRGFLGSLAALGAGLLGAHPADAQVTQWDCGNVMCAANPGVCNPGCVCCVYTNPITGRVINSRCRPSGTCSPGTEVGGTTTPAPTTTTTTTATPTTTTTTTACPTEVCGSLCCPPESPVCAPSGRCVECVVHDDCVTDPDRPYCASFFGLGCVDCLPNHALCTSDEQCCTERCFNFACEF